MLGLKLATDPKWVTIVESNIEEILTDHAWCEQKAATNIITIITYNSEHEELVTDLLEIAKEELEHFQMVHNIIKERGLKLGRERKDHYVNELFKFLKKEALLVISSAISISFDEFYTGNETAKYNTTNLKYFNVFLGTLF